MTIEELVVSVRLFAKVHERAGPRYFLLFQTVLGEKIDVRTEVSKEEYEKLGMGILIEAKLYSKDKKRWYFSQREVAAERD